MVALRLFSPLGVAYFCYQAYRHVHEVTEHNPKRGISWTMTCWPGVGCPLRFESGTKARVSSGSGTVIQRPSYDGE
jgi:hypothetical protein